MNAPEPNAKPAAQSVGAAGIGAAPLTLHAPPAVDWGKLVQLPPFQLFAVGLGWAGGDALECAQACVRARGAGAGLLADYTAWFNAQGRWPGETPLGVPVHA